jgi:hypothetical protein
VKTLTGVADAAPLHRNRCPTSAEYAHGWRPGKKSGRNALETLNARAELKIFIGKEGDYRNPEWTVNVLKFAQAQPASN